MTSFILSFNHSKKRKNLYIQVTTGHHGDNEGDDNKTAVCKGRNAADEPESTEQCAMLPSLINGKLLFNNNNTINKYWCLFLFHFDENYVIA